MDYFYKMDMKELGRKFAEELENAEQAPVEHETVFYERWQKCREFGLFEILELFKKDTGANWKAIVSLMYGIGLGSQNMGILFSINVQLWACISPIRMFCSSQAQKELYSRLIHGDCIGAHAISENSAGSDVFNIQCEYEKTPDGYRINGQKNYVTNAPYADVYLVYARKKGTSGYNDISCFLINKNTPGFHVGDMIPKMGMDFSPMASLYLDNCTVDNHWLLGKEKQGIFIFEHVMLYERPLLLSFQVGLMESQLNRNVLFCKNRKQGGMPIIKYQAVSHRLADMKVNLEASKLFLEDIVNRLSSNTLYTNNSSIAKLFISEKLVENSLMAMKNYGTFGYLQENGAQQEVRDNLGSWYYSGTSDIQRNIISRYL